MTVTRTVHRPHRVPHGPHDGIGHALADVALHPVANLVRTWSWKTATISAMLRAIIFLTTNRHAARHHAELTALAEALYSLTAAGLMGALTQRLRDVRPLWAAAVVVWGALPVGMVAVELRVHRLVHTQHVRVGLISSFLIASVSSGFTWYAMRRGVLLQGVAGDDVAHDLHTLPRILLDFILWPFRLMRWRTRS